MDFMCAQWGIKWRIITRTGNPEMVKLAFASQTSCSSHPMTYQKVITLSFHLLGIWGKYHFVYEIWPKLYLVTVTFDPGTQILEFKWNFFCWIGWKSPQWALKCCFHFIDRWKDTMTLTCDHQHVTSSSFSQSDICAKFNLFPHPLRPPFDITPTRDGSERRKHNSRHKNIN